MSYLEIFDDRHDSRALVCSHEGHTQLFRFWETNNVRLEMFFEEFKVFRSFPCGSKMIREINRRIESFFHGYF